MSEHRFFGSFPCLTMLIFVLLSSTGAFAADRDDYTGTLRIYMVEPVSRWTDGLGTAYHYGFLDFSLQEYVDLKDMGSFEQNITWNALDAGFTGVNSGNIMGMAVLMNSDYVLQDAFPGFEYWFQAHFVDAVAVTTPGIVGTSEPTSGFTHKVFVEQAGSGG